MAADAVGPDQLEHAGLLGDRLVVSASAEELGVHVAREPVGSWGTPSSAKTRS